MITTARVRELEDDAAELDALREQLDRFVDVGTPLPPGYSPQLSAALARVSSRLAVIRPGLASFPWTRGFLDITIKSDAKAQKLDIRTGSRESRILSVLFLQGRLSVSTLYLHRLLELLPRNVRLQEETRLFWDRWTSSRLKELPPRERRRFYAWSAIGIYGIASWFGTVLAFWFPILFKVIPSFLFPVVLTPQGPQAYPGILPSGLGYGSAVILVVLIAVEIHALYGFLDIQLRLHRIETGFRARWEEVLDETRHGELDAMNRALKQWPGEMTRIRRRLDPPPNI